MNEVNYTINYYYDNVDVNDKYKFVLRRTIKNVGRLGQEITLVPDYLDGFYFRTRDNLPKTLTLNENKNIINVYYTAAYRNEIYELATDSITDSISQGDANIFFKLLGCLYGDLYMQAKNIDDVISIDSVDEEHLRHLAKLVDYKWSEALTADKQRESIKFYTMLRRMRGTSFAITNLIRIFGQSAETLYQPSDNTGVRIIEYVEGNDLGMFPGDIRVEIPEMSNILRGAIEEVKLMGTRLTFAYRLPINSEYKDEYGNLRGYRYSYGWLGKISYWYQPGLKGWDSHIQFDRKLNENFGNKLIYKYRDDYKLHGSADLKTHLSTAYNDLWMFQVYGLENVRGVLLDDGVIDETLFLYR